MDRQWTVGQKIAAGFALQAVIALLIGLIGIYALSATVTSKDLVIDVRAHNLVLTKDLAITLEEKSNSLRAYLLSHDDNDLVNARAHREDFLKVAADLHERLQAPEGKAFLANLVKLEVEHQALADSVSAMVPANAPPAEISAAFVSRVRPIRNQLNTLIDQFNAYEEQHMAAGVVESSALASRTRTVVIAALAAALLLAAVSATLITRGLVSQVGTAVQQVQSSAAELQSASSEQATASTEQKASSTEASTTLRELIATSRQMAESSQRVTRIAEDTARSAHNGDQTVRRAHESIEGIKRQVDQIVQHMLDLGRKSQQVGGVLDLINELADQTNILAINATIESAGAGEAGKRFGVVADEIRKLADRVGSSTKEIRALIDEIRASTNTTVMATEDGSKAVDAGARQFADVTAVFSQIVEQVQTTTEASREIELGTRQQVTAVEQVGTALQGIVMAITQNEATTRQTVDTATQLANLSRELMRLIRKPA